MMPVCIRGPGLAGDVRLGLLTEWVSAGLVDEVLAECGRRDMRPGANGLASRERLPIR